MLVTPKTIFLPSGVNTGVRAARLEGFVSTASVPPAAGSVLIVEKGTAVENGRSNRVSIRRERCAEVIFRVVRGELDWIVEVGESGDKNLAASGAVEGGEDHLRSVGRELNAVIRGALRVELGDAAGAGVHDIGVDCASGDVRGAGNLRTRVVSASRPQVGSLCGGMEMCSVIAYRTLVLGIVVLQVGKA